VKQDSKLGTNSQQWRSGSARPLAIPIQTKLAAASPVHGYLVSPGSKRTFLLVFRTMLTM
jgi:hypothetical protein